MDIEGKVTAALGDYVASGKLDEAVNSIVQTTVSKALKDVFGEYSDFNKKLKKEIESALQIDLKDIGLAAYNDTLLSIIKNKLQATTLVVATEQVEKEIEQLLAPAPKEIKLSELLNQFREMFTDEASEKGWESFTCIISESDYGHKWIHLQKEPNKEKYCTKYQFAVNREGEIFALNLDGHDMKKMMFKGSLYNFEHTLFVLYASGTKLIADVTQDEADNHYPNEY